ncbi:sulfurtransferase TusA family protein [Sulfobacillus harzensis]|uniref:Sulfurtransferase TusA family protein n=1 Tax=Sulfobacillus harzensis TaxID=2729629 RepID=A0A7Y0L2J7_9FIRM|nr:sulfurtransferase TusA family protein [Sulfobacillus harzensis]NMP21898.1 sulfurtransferase TusA family protein [Sulfobacillus harzensis]
MSEAKVVDARGSYCPGPLMELIKSIRQEPVGTVFEVWSSDRGSAKDIPEWVHKAGHEVLGNKEEDGIYKIQVRKVK